MGRATDSRFKLIHMVAFLSGDLGWWLGRHLLVSYLLKDMSFQTLMGLKVRAYLCHTTEKGTRTPVVAQQHSSTER